MEGRSGKSLSHYGIPLLPYSLLFMRLQTTPKRNSINLHTNSQNFVTCFFSYKRCGQRCKRFHFGPSCERKCRSCQRRGLDCDASSGTCAARTSLIRKLYFHLFINFIKWGEFRRDFRDQRVRLLADFISRCDLGIYIDSYMVY